MKSTLILCYQYLDLFLIFLHCAEDQSFNRRTSIVGKSINVNESDLKSLPQNVNTVSTQPPWLSNLRTRIDQYIKKYGYKDAKSHIKKLVEETEKSENVLLDVKVAHNGTIDVDFGPVLRSSKRKKENKRGFDIEPQWLIEFKEFIHELIQNYGREKVENMIEHFIETIETKHVVKIKDIDVNPFGEISVKYEYIKKSHKRKKESFPNAVTVTTCECPTAGLRPPPLLRRRFGAIFHHAAPMRVGGIHM